VASGPASAPGEPEYPPVPIHGNPPDVVPEGPEYPPAPDIDGNPPEVVPLLAEQLPPEQYCPPGQA